MMSVGPSKLILLLLLSFMWPDFPCSCCALDVQIKGEVTKMAISPQELSHDQNSVSPFVNLSLVHQKLLLLLGMLLTTLLSGLLPLRLYSFMGDSGRKSTWEAIISFSSCFSGGVFMAAAFLDLIPETNVKIKEVLELIRVEFGVEVDFPVTEFTILVGFLLVLTIEQSVLHWQETWTIQPECSLERGTPLLEGASHDSPLLERVSPMLESNNYQSVPSQEPTISSEITLDTNCSNSTSSQVSPSHHDDSSGDDHGDHSHMTPAMFQQSVLRSFLLLLALTFHSVFEGIAIGLQEKSTGLVSLFLAVIVHKCIMSLSLGLNLAQANLKKKTYVMSILVFAAASPVGVGIGIGVVGLPESLSQDIVSGVLQALAAGTFLYITFFEVLPHELNLPGRRISKVGFVILGFIIMCILLGVAPHDHAGEQHQHHGQHQHQGQHRHGDLRNKSFLSEPHPFFESHKMNNFEPNNGHVHHGNDAHDFGHDGGNEHDHDNSANNHGHNAHDHGGNEHDHDHSANNYGHNGHNQDHNENEHGNNENDHGHNVHDHDIHGHHFYSHDNHAKNRNLHHQTDTHHFNENAKKEYHLHEHKNERHDDVLHDQYGHDHSEHHHNHLSHDHGNDKL